MTIEELHSIILDLYECNLYPCKAMEIFVKVDESYKTCGSKREGHGFILIHVC